MAVVEYLLVTHTPRNPKKRKTKMTQFAVKHTNGSFHTARAITSAAPMCPNFTLIKDQTVLFSTFDEARRLANQLNKTDHNWFVVRFDPWTMPTGKILNFQ